MALCRTGIFGIELGIRNAVKAHGAVTGGHHAKHDEHDNAGRFISAHVTETICRNPHGANRKRHCKQRMAQTDKMCKFKDFIHVIVDSRKLEVDCG